MSYVEKHVVEVVTATGGGATGYTPVVTGRIAAILYTRPTGTPYASTADFDVSTADSEQTLWAESNVNASEVNHPVAVGNLPSGVASSLTEVPLYAAGERVKIAVSNGGNTKIGTFTVIVA